MADPPGMRGVLVLFYTCQSLSTLNTVGNREAIARPLPQFALWSIYYAAAQCFCLLASSNDFVSTARFHI